MRFIVIRLKYVIFAVLAVAVLTVILLTPNRSVMTFLSDGREIPIYSVERQDSKIALTFDCAWNADDIDNIIDTLNMYNCKATFFVTGKWAEQYSGAVNKLYRNGFEIGIHSYNHDDYTKMNAEQIAADIEKCNGILTSITGAGASLVRAPSGAYNDNVVRTVEKGGRMCIQWSVDGLDYTDTTTEEIFNRIASKTAAGDIILLHNGTDFTAAALPGILDHLSREFELVNVSDIIYKDNFTIDHKGRQIPNGMI